jgi:proteasome lid subunit RPN8/RPN11
VSAAAIALTADHIRAIESAAEAAYPEEACGLLIGHDHQDGRHEVSVVEASANVAAPPRAKRFEVDPKLRLRLERELRDRSEKIVGVYHSHPNGDPTPSDTDIGMIFEPALTWLITAVSDGRARETRAFRPTVDGSAFIAITLDIVAAGNPA